MYKLQGAMTVIDNRNGKVVAVVGGRSQDTDYVYSLNRAFQSPRQPGSTIKPIAVYAPAFENGYKPNSIVTNISVSAAKKKGVDVQKLGGGLMVLRNAVEQSINGVAWRIFDDITPATGLSFLENMHFSYLCPNDYFNAASLGGLTYGATTVEMASAYSALANHGQWSEPTCITNIIDKHGRDVYTYDETHKVYQSKVADDMVDVLKGVLTRGTGARLGWSRMSNIEAFGKTGTTNSSKDGWFCGATPYYSIAVWVGYDTPKAMSNLYGATYPGQIWASSMDAITDGFEPAEFTRDKDDSSYTNIVHSDNWYSYLPGREADEELSLGYTVADYRDDRIIGEDVQLVINAINNLDPASPNLQADADSLYSKGCMVVGTIYSSRYRNEMQAALDIAYSTKISPVSVPVAP